MNNYAYQVSQAGPGMGYYLAGGFFYVFLIVFLFFGICTAWILIRNGKSRLFAAAIAGSYLVIFFSLVAEGMYILSVIKEIS
jgi:hypothetical protein